MAVHCMRRLGGIKNGNSAFSDEEGAIPIRMIVAENREACVLPHVHVGNGEMVMRHEIVVDGCEYELNCNVRIIACDHSTMVDQWHDISGVWNESAAHHEELPV